MTRQIMKGLFCVGILLLCCVEVTGQDYAEFTADRPGASTGPAVVGHRVIQLEQGIQYDGDGGAGTITFSNTLLRYGLFPRMEIRVSGDGFLYRPDSAWEPRSAVSRAAVQSRQCLSLRTSRFLPRPAKALMSNIWPPHCISFSRIP